MDIDIEDLKTAGVRRVTVSHDWGRPGAPPPLDTTTYVLDNHDRIVERLQYMAHGLHMRSTFHYDETGALIESRDTGTNPDGASWTKRTSYSYDERGRCLLEQEFGPAGKVWRTRRFEYRADGSCIEAAPRGTSITVDLGEGTMTSYGSGGSARAVYRPNRAPQSITIYGRFRRPSGKVLFESDASGRVTRVLDYIRPHTFGASVARPWLKPFTPLLMWSTNRFMNMWIRWNLARAGEWRRLGNSCRWPPLFSEMVRRYDESGRRIEEVQTMAARFRTIEQWTHDEAGRIVEHRARHEPDGPSSVDRYSYETDDRGHWIERLQLRFENGRESLMDTTHRAIEYRT